ncbi:hypothetical protein NIASO_07055 [Niabella soli DSM 19437]|uniref:Uncharacterized protein n=1 Tax=Niabella soli DSM 19437 TaxID=929713 RepID=W0F7T4_9BACT|nr:hypothetical protein NIASO_07055 [Niabella soli DSM 19437]
MVIVATISLAACRKRTSNSNTNANRDKYYVQYVVTVNYADTVNIKNESNQFIHLPLPNGYYYASSTIIGTVLKEFVAKLTINHKYYFEDAPSGDEVIILVSKNNSPFVQKHMV